MRRDGIEVQRVDGKRRDGLRVAAGRDHAAVAVTRQRARGECGAGAGAAHREALGAQAGENALQHRLLAAEEMAGAGDVEQQAARRIERHERREAVAPVGDAAEQLQIRGRVRRHHLQARHHRARIGERLADAQAQRRRLAVERGDGERVALFRRDDERRRVRRRSGDPPPAPLQPVGRKARKPQRHDPPRARGKIPSSQHHSITQRPVPPCRLRMSSASKSGRPQFSSWRSERAARTSQRVSAPFASGSAAEAQQQHGHVRLPRHLRSACGRR